MGEEKTIGPREKASGWLSALAVSAALAIGFSQLARASGDRPASSDGWAVAHARLIAIGIPGAGAVADVGDFLTGSPLHDKAPFAALTQPGHVLDPRRVLVASTSNFGAALARSGDPEGSILSIDPSGDGVAMVPERFGSTGGQASDANRHSPEVDALILQAGAKFLNSINPPAPAAACTASPGAAVFQAAGCASCDAPALPGPGARQPVNLYSDLLLHHMGPALADSIPQGSAAGDEWRTMPLWRVSERAKFLHDGRASSLSDAILAHDGQGRAARDTFATLDPASQQALMAFLSCL